MTLNEAKNKVLRTVNDNRTEDDKYIIDEAGILNTQLAWYIPFVEANQNNKEILIGTYKGFIVDKTTGEMDRPGSGLGIEEWLVIHELGLLNGPHDFIITGINDYTHTRKLLEMLHLKYFKSEVANGTTWKIPKTFTAQMIDERLEALPCIFKNQKFAFLYPIFQIVAGSKVFEYKLTKSSASSIGDIGEEIK